MVVGELHPDDIFPKVIRNRTKPSAGLDEDEAKEEAAKYRSASEASIKPHTDVKDEYSGDKIPPKLHVKGKLRDFPFSMNSPGII
jgi:hypothetical protein